MVERLANAWEAMKNPSPERLTEIEFKSHFLQIGGIIIAGILIVIFAKPIWYIIFAFIFGVGVSYSQGMNAYRRYKTIKKFSPVENPKDFEKDISFTRRRGKIISHSYGKWVSWIIIASSVVVAMMVIDPTISRWKLMILYPLTIFIIYFVFYYVFMYPFAYSIYKEKIKGEKKE